MSGTRRTDRIPFRARPMLATLVPAPVRHRGWIYEEKYDGIRIMAYKEGSRVTLRSRNDKDKTEQFAGVAGAVRELSSRTLLLDGEVVVFDQRRISRFQLLQRRQLEPAYAVFDCLYRDGHDLRRNPLIERRAALEAAIGGKRRRQGLFATRLLCTHGLAAYHRAQERGLEGVVAKDPASPYIEGRSTKWLKVKVHAEEEFVIGGYTRPAGSRTHFGALLLGAYAGPHLHYVGKVGTGFSRATLASLYRRFQSLTRQTSALRRSAA